MSKKNQQSHSKPVDKQEETTQNPPEETTAVETQQTTPPEDSQEPTEKGGSSALDVMQGLKTGQLKEEETEATDQQEKPKDPTEGADQVLGDMSEDDPDAQQIAKDVEASQKPQEPSGQDNETQVPPPPNADRVVNEYEAGFQWNVEQVLAHVATQPDPNYGYQRLLEQGKVQNPWATEQEMVRLGYYVDPRHDKDGKIIA